jgi:hypothetical protein
LSSWDVDSRYHFSGRVLDLETRIEFKEIVLVFSRGIEIFNGTWRIIREIKTLY